MFNPLNPNHWPFALKMLPQPAYLVGGSVRDALINRRSKSFDLDFIIPDKAVSTARRIASYYRAGFVLLDAKRQIARVVFPRGTVDFAQQDGDSLLTDLQRRDFTINAIAYNPFTKEIIDPFDGQIDLKEKIIRMVKAENLADDPLRLLRAYRQGCQLGLTIESATFETIKDLAPSLHRVAAERIRTELGYLLEENDGVKWIKYAWKDGLLKIYFPQGSQHFDQLDNISYAYEEIIAISPHLKKSLNRSIKETIKTSLLALAKLTLLVNPDPDIATKQLQILKYSNAEIKGITAILKHLPILLNAGENMDIRAQYFLFKDLNFIFPAFALICRAFGANLDNISPLIQRYLNPDDPVAHPIQLINGNELIQELKIPSSPRVGQLLLEIQMAQIEGKISDREQALELAIQLLKAD